MSQRLVELCSLFVENTYGELAAQIFNTLASRGRSSIATLSQLTRIHSSRIRAGLALLIQHHIVRYYDADADDPNIPTFYSADLDAAYNLTRAHKYVKIVGEREGQAAGKLLANIFELGHASVGDLESAYEFTSASKHDNGIVTVDQHMTEQGDVNGVAKDGKHKTVSDFKFVDEFHSTLRRLLDEGYLVKVTERSYMPPADYEEEAKQFATNAVEETEEQSKRKMTAPKKAKEVNIELNDLKRKWEDEDSYSKTRDIASKGVIKLSKSSAPSNKRVKVNGDLTNGIHHEFIDDSDDVEECLSKLPNDLFVRVCFARCTLLLRNQRLEQMAHYYLGPMTSAVFGAMLKSLERTAVEHKFKPQTVKPETGKHEDDSEDEEDLLPSITDAEILEHLDKSIDLTIGVKVPKSVGNLPNGVGKRKTISDDPDEAELGIKIEKESDDEDEDLPANGFRSLRERNKRLSLVGMHLNILAEHPKRFIKRSWDSKSSRIDIAALNSKLVREEVDTMIGNRYSNIETRIVRCLREKGKLEEKQLQAMTMMRQQPLRIHLTFLQFAGICDSQELPKDASRQPNRVLHLWQFNERRVVNDYLHRAYQGMSRSLQRLRVEREGKFRAVIEKADRADVKGREQELLNSQEKNLLKEWREAEERILVQVDRLDDLVGVLRDFSGNHHGLMV